MKLDRHQLYCKNKGYFKRANKYFNKYNSSYYDESELPTTYFCCRKNNLESFHYGEYNGKTVLRYERNYYHNNIYIMNMIKTEEINTTGFIKKQL
jgi:hypothetical protein